jgi:hypothetical protein
VEDLGCILFRHWPCFVDLIEELSVFAELHEDVDLIFAFDDLVDLCDVFMHEVLLEFNLSLDGFDLVDVVGLQRGDLDRHCLSCQLVDRLLHLPEAALSDCLFLVIPCVLSS